MFLVRLHVIQFTRYRRCSCKLSLAANFYILAQLFSFVKYFFQVFKTFLKHSASAFLKMCAARWQLRYNTTSFSICQHLFSFFLNFFQDYFSTCLFHLFPRFYCLFKSFRWAMYSQRTDIHQAPAIDLVILLQLKNRDIF